MKIVWLSQIVNLKRNSEVEVKRSEGQGNNIRQVVTFADCQKINQSFAMERVEELNNRNQYVAALTGEFLLMIFK